ncbi:Adaptin N terminal region family protein [Histomonas meleagridis]|uniref:Adaptin N terminal region family protein n=1 Tax=Histomonas meleagridis TaxID=135588 RepID=UPI00355977C0|nr:Adaptin N terminal region family protein [Histomonas meleagridis]KAH0800683.1 Adaptin N terminal region family protein [Histomonas meleagridis]
MTKSLYDFVSSVRLLESPEEEKFIISTEKAEIRSYLRKLDPDFRPTIVAKLIFLNLMNQDTSWGQMETINLMASERFSYKSIGYIGASILLDPESEISMLTTQIITNDLNSQDINIQCLALSYIANNGSRDICRAVSSSVQRLFNSPIARIMKFAGMAAANIVRTNPDLSDGFKNSVQPLLNNSNHGVVNSGINLVLILINNCPKLAGIWKQFSGPFTKILKGLTNSRLGKEFKFETFNDPFMQINCLKALGALKKSSQELDELLQTIISSTVTKKNIGRSILYEAVETVITVSNNPSLRALAFNQIGRLFKTNNPSVIYSSLSAFARILQNKKFVVDANNVDTQALQRYKAQVVKCLDHQDPSIRRRALDVITALIDESNAESLIPEILAYVKLADSDFRTDMISRIYTATQKYAKSKEWNFDIIHQMLIESGNYISTEIITSFCELISNNPDLQQYSVEKLSASLSNFSENQSLVQVAAFIIGEFATNDNGELQIFKKIISLPQTKPETIMYIITSMSKLSVRFNCIQDTTEVLKYLMQNNNLEVQQRAGEMTKLLGHPEQCEGFFAPLNDNTTETSEQNPLLIVEDNKGNNDNSNHVDDLLLSILDNDFNTQQNDLLTLQTQPKQEIPSKLNGLTLLYEGNNFVIYGQSKVNPNDQRQVALQLVYYSKSDMTLTNFEVEYAVSYGYKMNVTNADRKNVSKIGNVPMVQIVYLLNENGQKFQLNVTAKYMRGNKQMNENGIINAIPL